jgi:hypothetical protein
MFATMTYEECFRKSFKTNVNLQPFDKDKWVYEVPQENGEVKWVFLTPEQNQIVSREFNTQKLEKRKLYPMIVRELVDTTHSAYLRALNGGERQSLHEARQVSQNETIMPGGMSLNMNGQPVMKERSLLNPMRWLKGQYK